MIITPPRRDEALIDSTGRPTLRFAKYLESLSSTIEIVTSETLEIVSPASELSIEKALISKLSERLDDIDATNDSDILNSRVAAISAKVNRLIEELIEAVKGLDTTLIDKQSLLATEAVAQELLVLNARFEETFPTGIEGRDV